LTARALIWRARPASRQLWLFVSMKCFIPVEHRGSPKVALV
jgi:hypothetical protein